MDIAVPPKGNDKSLEKIVSPNASTTTEVAVEKLEESSNAIDRVQEKSDLKDEALSKAEKNREKIAEIITSKKYFLPIREKRSKPLLTLAFLPKKSKKLKKKISKVPDTPQRKKANSTQTMLVVILVVVLIGAVVAIDAGMIDIGIKLPFDFIKNT